MPSSNNSLSHPKAADEVWAEIQSIYCRINDLIDNLPSEEKARMAERFQQLAAQEVGKWWAAAMKDMTPEQLATFLQDGLGDVGMKVTDEMFDGIRNMSTEIETKVRSHFTPRPRMTERDNEIVRLRDEDKLTFKQIGRQLQQINQTWVGKDGKPLSGDAAEKAYHRSKK